jgi:hypothetical protein
MHMVLPDDGEDDWDAEISRKEKGTFEMDSADIQLLYSKKNSFRNWN